MGSKFFDRFIRTYKVKGDEVRWRIVVPNGTAFPIRKRGFLRINEARAAAEAAYLTPRGPEPQVQPDWQTFKEFGQCWMKRQKLRPATTLRYEDELRWLNEEIGDVPMNQLSKAIGRQVRAALERVEHLSNSTRQMIFAMLKRVVKAAEADDDLPPTGILTLRNFPRVERKAKFWDAEQCERFLTALSDHDDFALWSFTLFTGVRAGELAALTWKNVTLFDQPQGNVWGVMQVHRTRCQKTGVIHESTKTKDRRQVPLLERPAMILKAMIRREGFIFGAGSTPLPLNRQKHFARTLKSAAKKAGIEPITYHQLRHSFISMCEVSGLARRLTQEIVGHRRSETTDGYSHVSNRDLVAALSKISFGEHGNFSATLAEA